MPPADAVLLADSSEAQRWLGEYEAQLQRLNRGELPELDRWAREELPAILASRTPAHVTGAELSLLMKRKLLRDKFRPRLQQFVDALEPAAVERASGEALALLAGGDLLGAVEPLKALKGVGPAFASMVLAVASEDVPVLSDAMLLGVPDHSREYTAERFEELLEEAPAMAAELGMTVAELEQALYAKWASGKKPRRSGGGGGERSAKRARKGD